VATLGALLESGMIALVLAAAIGLLAFGLFFATDALERGLDRPDRDTTARVAAPPLVVVPQPVTVAEPLLETA
jgi:hypothetical protein